MTIVPWGFWWTNIYEDFAKMIKNSFIKNLYQVISNFSVIMVFVGALLLGYLASLDYESGNGWYLLVIALALIVLFFGIGFYWIFQTVEIDEKGIRTKLFRKTIRNISWKNVTDIRYTSVARNPAYVISIANEKNLNLDARKSIKIAIGHYAPQTLKEKLMIS